MTKVGESLAERLDQTVSAPDVRAAVAAILRATHDAARARAAAKLSAGLPGVEVARLYCAAADDLLDALWRFTTETLYPSHNPTEAEKLSLIAVGGYGGGVLAPFPISTCCSCARGRPRPAPRPWSSSCSMSCGTWG